MICYSHSCIDGTETRITQGNTFTVHAIFILSPVAKYNNIMIIIIKT
jgi:hypothetical protein